LAVIHRNLTDYIKEKSLFNNAPALVPKFSATICLRRLETHRSWWPISAKLGQLFNLREFFESIHDIDGSDIALNHLRIMDDFLKLVPGWNAENYLKIVISPIPSIQSSKEKEYDFQSICVYHGFVDYFEYI